MSDRACMYHCERQVTGDIVEISVEEGGVKYAHNACHTFQSAQSLDETQTTDEAERVAPESLDNPMVG